MMTKFYMSVVIALNLMGSRGKMEGWGGRAKLLLGRGEIISHFPTMEESSTISC